MIRIVLVMLASAAALAAPAVASAPPVGPLPAGPTKSVVVKTGRTFLVLLPRPARAGYVWRLARPYDATVVHEVGEGEKGVHVWVRFRAGRVGVTRIVYAQTVGERPHAYAARRFAVHVVR